MKLRIVCRCIVVRSCVVASANAKKVFETVFGTEDTAAWILIRLDSYVVFHGKFVRTEAMCCKRVMKIYSDNDLLQLFFFSYPKSHRVQEYLLR